MNWLIVAGFLVGFCVYTLIVAYVASKSVDGAPRKDMYICDKHGPMPENSTVKLFDGDELDYVTKDGRTKRGPVRMCSICFEERIQTARKTYGQ